MHAVERLNVLFFSVEIQVPMSVVLHNKRAVISFSVSSGLEVAEPEHPPCGPDLIPLESYDKAQRNTP